MPSGKGWGGVGWRMLKERWEIVRGFDRENGDGGGRRLGGQNRSKS